MTSSKMPFSGKDNV